MTPVFEVHFFRYWWYDICNRNLENMQIKITIWNRKKRNSVRTRVILDKKLIWHQFWSFTFFDIGEYVFNILVESLVYTFQKTWTKFLIRIKKNPWKLFDLDQKMIKKFLIRIKKLWKIFWSGSKNPSIFFDPDQKMEENFLIRIKKWGKIFWSG